MRAVIQRVSRAAVAVGGRERASIGPGLLVLLGVEEADTMQDIEWLCGKIAALRIFNDQAGVMNISLKDTGGDLLLVSQFTLHASTRAGNRPSYIRAARPESARPLYEQTIGRLEKELGKPIHTGEFGADMQVELINDGPVTILFDTKNRE
jgi:D-tyrosyl-tRNA(Tyr) deacylase